MQKFNETRTSASIARKLLRERRLHLLPIYFLLRTSDLGREGIDHSGSYRFADHLYRGRPKGRFGVGKVVDAVLLSLPSSRSFRNRWIHARDSVLQSILSRAAAPSIRVLSVPAGIPRELAGAALTLRDTDPELFAKTTFYCLDIDERCLSESSAFVAAHALVNFQFIRGDAFDGGSYPRDLDIITSTGLGEFLTDDEWVRFYSICHERLVPGGVLISSATLRHKLSAYVMENFAELIATYRDERDLLRLFAQTPFREPRLRRDSVGYQVLISAARE